MCSAGQSMNRWSLEELVKRDPQNFLILLQQIITKTKEVMTQGVHHFTVFYERSKHYNLVVCARSGSGAVSVWAGGSPRHHVHLHSSAGTVCPHPAQPFCPLLNQLSVGHHVWQQAQFKVALPLFRPQWHQFKGCAVTVATVPKVSSRVLKVLKFLASQEPVLNNYKTSNLCGRFTSGYKVSK